MDRLSIVNVKLFMVQDVIHKAAAAKKGLDSETTQKLVNLNLQRNRLMAEIDALLDSSIRSGGAIVDTRDKLV